jgi:hypothetical protein
MHWIFPVHEVLWAIDEENYDEILLDAGDKIFLHH